MGAILRNSPLVRAPSAAWSATVEIIANIQGKREHHRRKSFQEEYRELLKRHEIEFDERYAWGRFSIVAVRRRKHGPSQTVG